MQKEQPMLAGEEHQLDSHNPALSWPRRESPSPERLPSPALVPKGHLPQSSSPSFLETYSRYVESSRSKHGQRGIVERERESWSFSLPVRQNSQSIRAHPGTSPQGGERNPAADGPRSRLSLERNLQTRSPDTRDKDTNSSGYTSWPADASTEAESPFMPATVARSPGLSAESLPSPSVHAAQQAGRAADDWQAVYYGTVGPRPAMSPLGKEEDRPASHGTVAAVVNILESRSRDAHRQEIPSPQQDRLTSKSAAEEPSERSSASIEGDGPSSPWPAVHYQPSPRHPRQYNIEVRVHSPAGEAPAETPVEESTAQACDNGEADGEEDRAAVRNAALAALLEERPELHSALTDLIQSAMDGTLPEAQVQTLLADQPDLVETLNALHSASQEQSDAPLRHNRDRQGNPQEASTCGGPRQTGEKRFMVVMRNVKSKQLTGLESELDKQGIEIRRGWDEFSQYLVPPVSKRYVPLWTFAFLGAVLSIFFFMAGGYASFLERQGSPTPVASQSAPSDLQHWLALSPAWRSFNFDYLLLWGGQYLPAIKGGQSWRWISAVFLHVSFQHLLANALLFAVLGGLLELRYGSLRIFTVWVLSAFGAAFFAGSFGSSCTMVVGSSGAVLGFLGLTVADLVVNFETVWLALVRLVIIFAAVSFFIVTAITRTRDFTSNWSHLGGFVCGLFPSFLFLPSFKDRRWRKARKLAERMGILTPHTAQRQRPGRSVAISATSAWQAEAQAQSLPRENDAPPASVVQSAQDSSQMEAASSAVIPRGGIALPGLALEKAEEGTAGDGDIGEGSGSPEGVQTPSPGGNEAQDTALVMGTERSDAYGRNLPRINTRRPSRSSASSTKLSSRWQRLCCQSWLKQVHFVVLLGVGITLGIFVALPTYIYVVRIPATRCSA